VSDFTVTDKIVAQIAKRSNPMRKLVFCLAIICILFSFIGCKPKYVAAESMEKVYSMAIEELEKAKTQQETTLTMLKVRNEILKAILWYSENDKNNPRVMLLREMLSITE
jgi:ABC-type uncharacterized transport system auxiliary subunit